jgi:hypothetical protein
MKIMASVQAHRLLQHDHRGSIAPQLAVSRQQQHRLCSALAYQQPIKRIAVIPINLQLRHRQQVGGSDREPTEALQRHLALQLRQIHPQAADRHLDRHLPQRGLAHKHLSLRCLHPLHHRLRQSRIAIQPPQQQVGVEQQPAHVSASKSSSSGASKSSASWIWPRIAPGAATSWAGACQPTSRAIGTPDRAITTSPPCSTSCSSWDRWVLAWWMFTRPIARRLELSLSLVRP